MTGSAAAAREHATPRGAWKAVPSGRLLLRLVLRAPLGRQRPCVPDAEVHPPGKVVVAGEVASPSAVIVRVIDNGAGIVPGEEDRIFERFHRSDNRLSRSTAGVVLGLYITRNIVERISI